MQSADTQNAPVSTQAVLIDPESMTVVWVNEAASRDRSARDSGAAPGISIGDVVPMAEALGVPEALRTVADTGAPRHLHADVFSTAGRTVSLVVSIYRLPHGTLLLLSEHALRVGRR